MIFRRPRIRAAGAVLSRLLAGAALTAAAAEIRGEPPVAGKSWNVPIAANASLELVWIPAGEFTMGSPSTEPGRKSDEGPQTRVTLTKGFWLGKTVITIGQWKSLMGVGVRDQLIRQIKDDTLHNIAGRKQTLREMMNWSRDIDPSRYLANESDDLPMYFISWNDAMEFCEILNARERAADRLPAGYAYNLPTEAQWEYACRAGSHEATYAGPSSEESLDRIAWYAANSAVNYEGRGLGPTKSGPRAVKGKEPNAWGLHDMYGNIWQWCRDWYGPYPGGSVIDPIGSSTGSVRVNRGGSFGSAITSERSACRAANPPFEASAYRGFRIALCPLSSTPPVRE